MAFSAPVWEQPALVLVSLLSTARLETSGLFQKQNNCADINCHFDDISDWNATLHQDSANLSPEEREQVIVKLLETLLNIQQF